MKKIYKFSIYFSCFILLLCSCSSIDYSLTKIFPEETNIEFIKISDDNILGPCVIAYRKFIKWYTPNYIDISPDGKRIAYISIISNENQSEYFLIIRSLIDKKNILKRKMTNDISGFGFSKDGKKLVFSSFFNGSFKINVLDVETGEIKLNVVNSEENETTPIFSKDGSIFYTRISNIDKEYEKAPTTSRSLEKINTKEINLNIQMGAYKIFSYKENKSKSIVDGYGPSLSSDDKKMAICKKDEENNSGAIWLIDSETGIGNPIVTSYKKSYSTARISPDGKKIVFVGSSLRKSSEIPVNLDIYVVNVDGTQLKQLTFHPGHDISPAWSSDMKSIYFISERGNANRNYGIWKVDIAN